MIALPQQQQQQPMQNALAQRMAPGPQSMPVRPVGGMPMQGRVPMGMPVQGRPQFAQPGMVAQPGQQPGQPMPQQAQPAPVQNALMQRVQGMY